MEITTLILILLVWFLLSDIKPANFKPRRPRSSPKLDRAEPPLDLNVFKTHKRQYLKSDRWQSKRRFTLARDHYTCQSCGIDGVPLEIHHISYANYGDENPEDLVSLCRHCHQSIHDKLGHDYNTKFTLGTKHET